MTRSLHGPLGSGELFWLWLPFPINIRKFLASSRSLYPFAPRAYFGQLAFVETRPCDLGEGRSVGGRAYRRDPVDEIYGERPARGMVGAGGPVLGRTYYHGVYAVRKVIMIPDVTGRK